MGNIYDKLVSIVTLDEFNRIRDFANRYRWLFHFNSSSYARFLLFSVAGIGLIYVLVGLSPPRCAILKVFVVSTLITLLIAVPTFFALNIRLENIIKKAEETFSNALLRQALVGYLATLGKLRVIYHRNGYTIPYEPDEMTTFLRKIANGEITYDDYLSYLVRYAKYDFGKLLELDIEMLKKGKHKCGTSREHVLEKLEKLREVIEQIQ